MTSKAARKPLWTEDWLAVFAGLLISALALLFAAGVDVLGWVITTSVWSDFSAALKPVSSAYAGLPAIASLLLTYVFLLAILALGAWGLGADPKRFAKSFTAVFFFSYLCWIAGAFARIAATPNQRAAHGLGWSLNLTSEAGYILALVVGLLIGNFSPSLVAFLRDALRPELYIKTAIVILGAFLGVTAAEQFGLAGSIMFRGLCAILEAYLIYWALVYWIARKYFRFSREWAVPLASGISICGVSAAIATGSAIKARPIVPVMVSSLVVVFAVIEVLVLPFFAQQFLYTEPMVAGAWMGLAVKTDGAAVASGAITESLILAKAAAEQGVQYTTGWIVAVTTTVKVFIDIFIALWAFLLAWIWSVKIEGKRDEKISPSLLWERFPKFILGYLLTFAAILAAGILLPAQLAGLKTAVGQANVIRSIFFVMTFFSIGVVTDFRKLWQEGIGRLALVYVACLFGFIIWIGLFISWLFFSGVKPPLAAG
jgi:uncharacterized membrane protein YadS